MTVGTHISDEDRRAATTVTTSGSGHKFEIQLGHLCNNRCVFCSSGQLTAMKIARAVPIEPIIEALEEQVAVMGVTRAHRPPDQSRQRPDRQNPDQSRQTPDPRHLGR